MIKTAGSKDITFIKLGVVIMGTITEHVMLTLFLGELLESFFESLNLHNLSSALGFCENDRKERVLVYKTK